MPRDDAQKWDRRYKEDPRFSESQPNSLLTEYADLLQPNRLALDLAMGTGRNANFLLKQGMRVIGVDISTVAVKKAKAFSPDLQAVIADLEHFYIPSDTFDVITNFLYLQRNLWSPMVHGLKIGGILFVECLTEEMLSIHADINPLYLVKSGELIEYFATDEMSKFLELVYYQEGWQPHPSHSRAVGSLIARRYA